MTAPSPRQRRRRLSLLVVCAFLLAACGGSDPGEASDPEPTSGETGTPTETADPAAVAEELGPVSVGIAHLTDMVEFAEAMGADPSSLDPGDGEAQASAVVDYINEQGGVAGRPIEPVFYEYSAMSIASGTDAWEEACALWTEDNSVSFVAAGPMNGPLLLACLAKKNVPMISAETDVDQELYEQYGEYYYQPSWPKMERLAALAADGFVEQGMLGPDDTLGIIYWDEPMWARVATEITIPRLESHGITPEVAVAAPGFADANHQGYVVQMKDAGVTHVMFLGEKNGYPWFFSNAADPQGYTPTYLMTSDNKPFALEGLMIPAQLENAVALGWQPSVDVSAPEMPGDIDASELCLSIMDDAGLDMTTSIRRNAAFYFCDQLFLLHHALTDPADMSAEALDAGVASLETFPAANTFSASLGPDRHDGPNTYRPLTFDTGCSCFVYGDGEFDIPDQ